MHYGSVQDANEYFAQRLHEHAWTGADPLDRPKALLAATRVIDQLNFKGDKVDPAQELQFPRGEDTEPPREIVMATYELAHSLLDGKDPEMELENIQISSQGIGSLRTTYHRSQEALEHLMNFIPSPLAWRWIKPFLRDASAIKLSRVS